MAWTYLIARVGAAFQIFAFTFIAWTVTKSALAAVMVGIAFAIAFGLAAMPAGRMAHRFSNRGVVVWISLAKAAIYAVVLALEIAGELSLLAILISSAASGVTSSMHYPSWKELLEQFSAEGRLDETNALFSSLDAVGAVVGAVIGAIVIDRFGAGPVFAFNVVSYLPLALIVSRFPSVGAQAPDKSRAARVPLKKVFATISKLNAVRLAILLTALVNLLGWPLVALLPKVASELGPEARVYGALLASFYVGAALVAIFLREWKMSAPYGRIISHSIAAGGCALVITGAVGLAPLSTTVTFVGLIVMLAITGFGITTAQSVLGAITQLGVPKKTEGEVLGVLALTMIFFSTVGSFTQGLLADELRIWWLPLASGVLIVIAITVIWLRHGFLLLNASDPSRKSVLRHAEASSHEGASAVLIHGGTKNHGTKCPPAN